METPDLLQHRPAGQLPDPGSGVEKTRKKKLFRLSERKISRCESSGDAELTGGGLNGEQERRNRLTTFGLDQQV